MDARQPEPSRFKADSLADTFNTITTWAAVLEPHGWTLVSGDGDERNSQWRAPGETETFSAQIRTCQLCVHSPHTAFGDGLKIATILGHPISISKFRAFAILDHDGDLDAAANAIRAQGRAS